jgi:Tol biopolymer transport system component
MGLQPGDRLGPYEIVSHLGSGGMGEVYKARDTRLNRDVAVKVLPTPFARDPDRLARLEQEARAAAALNAPGIVAVHDIGTDSTSAQPRMYVVMELLEGDSLRGRLDSGPVPPRKAAEYAAQIASALAVAHGRGIVHRDLKPENLFITKDGRIKILDFGLAKEMVPSASAASMATGIGGTAAGTVLGTVGYMAPEQVRGDAADARSDIFALGATLYEMLTGRRAFAGETAVETMNAILKQDPPELSPEVTASIPGALQAILARCLEKRPDDRFHSAHDLALALQAANAGRSTSTSVEAPAPRKSSAVPIGIIVGMAGIGFGLAAVAFALLVRPDRAPLVAAMRQLTEVPGAELNPDISPDGRQIAYASAATGHSDIYLLRVGGGRAINLTSSQVDDSQPAFSPDGEQIAFRSERDGGGIFVMGATGESVRRLTTAGYDPHWSRDGKRIAYGTEPVNDPYSRAVRSQLWIVDVGSGQTTKLLDGDGVQPVWSPGDKRIAYWANTGGQRDIWTIAPSGGEAVAVTKDAFTDWAPEWSPDGKWLYFVSDRGGSPNLWQVPMDEGAGNPTGPAQMVTNGVRPIGSARFARDGARMVLGVMDRSFDLDLYNFDPANPDRVTRKSSVHSPSLGWCAPSKDASWLACTSRSSQEDIVLMRADGSETRRLTDDPAKDRIPSWSPDDASLAFMSTRSGRWQVWTISADGSGLRQLSEVQNEVAWGVWSPDGKRIVTSGMSVPPYGLQFFAAATPSAVTAPEMLTTDSGVINADTWSSDGRLISGSMTDAGGQPVAVMVWDVATKKLFRRIDMPLIRTTSVDTSFVYGTHDLVTHAPDGVALVNVDTGQWRVIFKVKPPFSTLMSGDGRTLVVERPVVEADVWMMEFVK